MTKWGRCGDSMGGRACRYRGGELIPRIGHLEAQGSHFHLAASWRSECQL